ncbi:MAG: methyl-accepting chemotaxis protein, partial [Pseudomonadota bacterium]
AGEHGKGFAVVASEVRKLAERSQEAAGEISDLVETTLRTSQDAGAMLERLVPIIKKTSELMQDISIATNEQNSAAEEINHSVLDLDVVVQQNTQSVQEANAIIEDLKVRAETLSQDISFFSIDDVAHSQASRDSEVASVKTEGQADEPEEMRLAG